MLGSAAQIKESMGGVGVILKALLSMKHTCMYAHWGTDTMKLGCVKMPAVALPSQLTCNKKHSGGSTTVLLLRFSFLKSGNKMGKNTKLLFLCGCLWEMIAVIGKATLLWNLPFMGIRCVTERVMWCGGELVRGRHDLHGKHTQTQLFVVALERVHRLKHTQTHTQRGK